MKTTMLALVVCFAAARPALARGWPDGNQILIWDQGRVKEFKIDALASLLKPLHTQEEDPVFRCASNGEGIYGFNVFFPYRIGMRNDGAILCVERQISANDSVLGSILAPDNLRGSAFRVVVKNNEPKLINTQVPLDFTGDVSNDDIRKALTRVLKGNASHLGISPSRNS